jgi:hypothetical protein
MKTITFYSYKGGTGRTLAVANAARFLARCGRRVFVLDFDLEAPGLHYKLGLTDRGIGELRGVVDFVTTFKKNGAVPDLTGYVYEVVDPNFEVRGSIHLMPAGNAPSARYTRQLAAIEWGALFNPPEADALASRIPLGPPLFLELKARIQNSAYAPEFLLIDSRTGVTEIGGVALLLMPDSVVCLVHNNKENLFGARRILRSVLAAVRPPGQGKIEVLPVLARLPEMEPEKEAPGLEEIKRFFSDYGATPELSQILTLHSDPNLQIQEVLLIGAQTTPNDSVLLRDYFRLFQRLGLDEGMTADERSVLADILAADDNTRLRSLLPGRRRSGLDLLAKPESVHARLARPSARLLKWADAAYVRGNTYNCWIHLVRDRLTADLAAQLEEIPSGAVRWELLALQLREGVLDFCGEPYFLTDNRSHLVEVIQLGWCRTFGAYAKRESSAYQILQTAASREGFEERMVDLLRRVPDLAVGVLGDTAAASEANRILSRHVETARLMATASEPELFRWLEEGQERIAICDHSVISKLKDLDSHGRYASDLWFAFKQPIPTGLAYPHEDTAWRKELARAVAYSFVDDAANQLPWDRQAEDARAVAVDLGEAGVEALSFSELCSSLTLDLPFDEAVRWHRALQEKTTTSSDAAAAESAPAAQRRSP